MQKSKISLVEGGQNVPFGQVEGERPGMPTVGGGSGGQIGETYSKTDSEDA